MDTSFKYFNAARKEFDGPDATLYEVNGQCLFPLYLASGGISTKTVFYVWDGTPHDGDLKDFAVVGEYKTNDTAENVREAVRLAFAKFREKK